MDNKNPATTDYAGCQGAYYGTGNSVCSLRSHSSHNPERYLAIYYGGDIIIHYTYDSSAGVRPTCWIIL